MVDVAANTRRRMLQKTLAWSFWAANLSLIVYFWWPDGIYEITSGDIVVALHALARLLGLLATFCALTQFILMGRLGWLEPIFGLDRMVIFHRRNGVATLSFILAHSVLMTITHQLLQGSWDFLGIVTVPYVWLAMIAEVLFITTVGLSITIVRKHLKFETWYAVHLCNYAAIALVPWHQLTNGSDFLANPTFANYWVLLYLFTAFNVVFWRFGKPVWQSLRHQFTVERVVKETPTATSVYIRGRNLQRLRAKGGQFVLVRFFNKDLVLQEHPFSLSRLPTNDTLRLTIRQLGDYTNLIPQLQPGTRVWVSGPFGSFTHQQQHTNKLLYIVGGIGITPVRSMIEDQANRGEKGNAVLLYGNRTQADTIFWQELTQLGKKIAMPIINVLSDQKGYTGETGYIDKEKITRLVPDVMERDVFVCGPPIMMWNVIDQLKEIGVPPAHIHYERFSLHKD